MGMCGGDTCEIVIACVAGGLVVLFAVLHTTLYLAMKAKVHLATRVVPEKTHRPARVKSVVFILSSPNVEDVMLVVSTDPFHVSASCVNMDPERGWEASRRLPVQNARLSPCSLFLSFKLRRRDLGSRTCTYRLLLGYDTASNSITARGFWWRTSFKMYTAQYGPVAATVLTHVKDLTKRYTRASQMRIVPAHVLNLYSPNVSNGSTAPRSESESGKGR